MSKHGETISILETAGEILTRHPSITLRQRNYQLVSRQVIKDSRAQYQAVSNARVWARQEGIIPWKWIEDRLRRPKMVSIWKNLVDFRK